MQRRTITAIETPYLNEIKEGQLYIDIDENTGKIRSLKKKQDGKFIDQIETINDQVFGNSLSQASPSVQKWVSKIAKPVAVVEKPLLFRNNGSTIYLDEETNNKNVGELYIDSLLFNGHWSYTRFVDSRVPTVIRKLSNLGTQVKLNQSNVRVVNGKISLTHGAHLKGRPSIQDSEITKEVNEKEQVNALIFPEVVIVGDVLIKHGKSRPPYGSCGNTWGFNPNNITSSFGINTRDITIDYSQIDLSELSLPTERYIETSQFVGDYGKRLHIICNNDYSYIYTSSIKIEGIVHPVVLKYYRSINATKLTELHYYNFPSMFTDDGLVIPDSDNFDFSACPWVIGVKESLVDNSLPVQKPMNIELSDVTLEVLTEEDKEIIRSKGYTINGGQGINRIMIGDFD